MKPLYTLTPSDFQLIENLIKVTISLDDLYQKIYQYKEIEPNHHQFEKHLDYLEIALEVEQHIYQQMAIETLRGQAITEYIIDNDFFSELDPNLTKTVLSDNNRHLYNRIYQRLIHQLQDDSQIFESPFTGPIIAITQNYNHVTPEQLVKKVNDFIKVEHAIFEQIAGLFLWFVEQMIKDPDNESIIADLTKTKFLLGFNFPGLEIGLKNNKFIVDEQLVINHSHYISQLNLDYKKYQMTKEQIGTSILLEEIKNIIEIPDDMFQDQSVRRKVALRKANMRCAFLLLEPAKIMELLDGYDDFFLGSEYLSKYGHHHIGFQHIESVFKNINHDQECFKTLSLIKKPTM